MNLAEAMNDEVLLEGDSCAISFDFASAFITVARGYIIAVMDIFSFPNKMKEILKLMITGMTARIVDDNENLSRPFIIRPGVPQGDIHSLLTLYLHRHPSSRSC